MNQLAKLAAEPFLSSGSAFDSFNQIAAVRTELGDSEFTIAERRYRPPMDEG